MPGGAENGGHEGQARQRVRYSPRLRIAAADTRDDTRQAEGGAAEANSGRLRPLAAGGAVLLLAVVALAVWSLYRGSTISAVEKKLECAQAAWSSIEQALEVDGVVVRDEKVYVTPISGTVKLAASEGERVRAGSVVAEVAEEKVGHQVELSLKKAQEELSKFDAYARARLGELEKGVAARRLDVENEKRALARARSSHGAEAVRRHASALAEARKALDESVRDLERERKTLELEGQSLADRVKQREATYRRAVLQLRAQTPGVVSFELDGLEHVLSPRTCKDLGPDQAYSLVPSPSRVEAGASVDPGQPIFRLIDNYRLFVLVFPGNDQTSALEALRSLRVRFASIPGGPFAASRVSWTRGAGPDRQPAMLLEVSGFSGELCYARRVRVSIIEKTISGIVIPRRSLVHTDAGDAVYVPVNLGVMRKPVRVKAGDAERAVVEGLREGQRVVTNPSMIDEANVTVWR